MKHWIVSVILVTACKGSSAGKTHEACVEAMAKDFNMRARAGVPAAELVKEADTLCPSTGMTEQQTREREKEIEDILHHRASQTPAELEKQRADQWAELNAPYAGPPKANGPAVTVTATEKPPFESVTFRMTTKQNDKGWPKFEAYNLGMKTIKFMAIIGYAYDKDGKQVARTTVPLSWNGSIAPGGKSDWDIEMGAEQVPATAASYELCFNSIEFDGDAASTDDKTRCAEQKAKGAEVVPTTDECMNNPLAKGC